MKKRIKYSLISLGIVIVLFFTVGGYLIDKYYHESVRSKPIMYCYQTYFGPPNSVLIITDLEFKNELIEYYDKMSKGDNPTFDIPLKTLPQFEPVYVMGYSNDSLLADVVSYYDRGIENEGSYLRGWVDVKTLHKTPLRFQNDSTPTKTIIN
ncbi:MAG: hypothetical protein HRT73_08300 [Flavobacteriales bacterium]|nr:hypothetical protein [Flavobacteriales bacterium]